MKLLVFTNLRDSRYTTFCQLV